MRQKDERIIGIDIGGTKMRGVLWNGKKVLKALELETPKSLTDFKSTLVKLVKFFGKASKIAIGAAGVIQGTKILQAPNIAYIKNFDLSDMDEFTSYQKVLDNDARCFGRAEYKIGSETRKKKVFFLTLGTGVGRAVGKNGKILKIKKFEYPERWEQEYKKFRDSQNNKKLADYLGKKLLKLIKPYQPQIVIVGGGVLARKGFFAEFKKTSRTQLQESRFGKNAVAVGAASFFNR